MKAELREKFVEARAKGISFNKIADELGVSKQTLLIWSKELNDQISEAQFIYFQSLMAQFEMAKAQRLTYLGKLYQRLTNELNERDFKEVETAKLLTMLLSVEEKLKGEVEKIRFTVATAQIESLTMNDETISACD